MPRLQLVSQIFANALVRKRSDAALRESEKRLQLAAEAADVGIDLATPVVESIGSEAESRFTGKTPKVTIEVR